MNNYLHSEYQCPYPLYIILYSSLCQNQCYILTNKWWNERLQKFKLLVTGANKFATLGDVEDREIV